MDGPETLRDLAVFFAKQGISPPVFAMLAEPPEVGGLPAAAAQERSAALAAVPSARSSLDLSPLSPGAIALRSDECPPATIICTKPVTQTALLPVVDRATARRRNKRGPASSIAAAAAELPSPTSSTACAFIEDATPVYMG